MTETGFSRCWESFVLHLSRNADHPVNIRPHDLRHTYCTILADSGVSIKQALVWMGHSDEKMILHVYDHITDRRTQESLDLVEKHLLSMQKTMQRE
jgi:integrase